MARSKLLQAAITGVASAAALAVLSGCETTGGSKAGGKTMGKCHGVNGCKGTGACGGDGHGCAGKNGCKAKGWLKMKKSKCESKGGKFEAM